jgi:hypothetical protein
MVPHSDFFRDEFSPNILLKNKFVKNSWVLKGV